MGLENLISNDLFYYSIYILSLSLIGTTGAMVVHIVDLKTSKWSVYQREDEGRKAYEGRLGKYVY